MEKDRFLKFLGICKKSGKVISGDFSVEKSLLQNKIKLLILAEDTAKDKIHKYTQYAKENNVELITCLKKEELGYAIGRSICAVIGVTDNNQKNKLLSLYEQISR